MIYLQIILAVVVGAFLLTVLRGAPYVPSRRQDIERAFSELYPLSTKDLLVDLGSGDGIVLKLASEKGARSVGFEINPILVLISKRRLKGDKNIKVQLRDFWLSKIPSETTVIYAFGENRDIDKIAEWIELQATNLGKKLYFISYGFELKKHRPVKKSGAMVLYKIEPLHRLLT